MPWPKYEDYTVWVWQYDKIGWLPESRIVQTNKQGLHPYYGARYLAQAIWGDPKSPSKYSDDGKPFRSAWRWRVRPTTAGPPKRPPKKPEWGD